MREYFLFLDTEASGLPKKWNQPYSNSANWPSAVQISWLVYKSDGTLVTTENHYISEKDIKIQPSAIKIHGITHDYLAKHGESRKSVMQCLAHDLVEYQPLVIGHFMEFDYHVASADFYRAGIDSPLENLPSFCTMQASAMYSRDPAVTHLRLGELYTTLFDEKLENPHNAFEDAKATAKCFFELLSRGDVNDEKIELQQSGVRGPRLFKDLSWMIFAIIIILLVILISFWSYE